MPETISPSLSRPMLGLLLRVKARAIYNHARHAVAEAPLRVGTAALLIGLIWLLLYSLFKVVFQQLEKTPLEATIAIPLVFNFFFVAMLVMLTLSNAIITYGALFGKQESDYLIAAPVGTLDLVTLKFLEGLALASWSLIVLGLPLMVAMADQTGDGIFYVLFIAFFLAFIPIPASLGLLLAWAAARHIPRRVMRWIVVFSGVALAGLVIYGLRTLRLGETAAEIWLESFSRRMSFLESALLPNNWVAAGIDHAMHNEFSESVLYLGVTIANAMFLSWVAVRFVAKHYGPAHDHATMARSEEKRRAASAGGGAAGLVFAYLPTPLRLIAAKDLRSFLRDPMQWMQLVILFGLMVLYLTNLPNLRRLFSASGWYLFAPFLNLCAVSLILATFTCRCVFPLLSLEGRQLWLIGLLPISRGRILLAKFAFAMTVSLAVAMGSMTLAIVILDLNAVWATVHLTVTFAICFGQCGFAVGLGARFPMFGSINVARIANGLGGTTNLLATVILLTVTLGGVGVATWWSRKLPQDAFPDAASLAMCGGAVIVSISAGIVALWIGARHFHRLEV